MNNTITITAANQKQNEPPPKYPLNPLVYITTSNMTKEKLAKLFTTPFIMPIVVTSIFYL